MDDPLLLPAGRRLVHIGPQKTGTTTLQGAFHVARRAVGRQGVLYAGANRQPKQAARAVRQRAGARTAGPPAAQRHWSRLLREVRRSRADRVLISAEAFADAPPAAIRRIVQELDPERVHIVATLRPLGRILPSQWQQLVQNGLGMPYDAWLRAVFEGPNRGEAATFWRRHRHHELLARWAAVVGPERITAVVVDERDHEAVLRTFERLLGLRTGTLRPEAGLHNRSLTRAEVELVQAMHRAAEELGVGKSRRQALVLHGAAASLKLRSPARHEPRTDTPTWVAGRLASVEREIVDGIAASGIRIVGDLERLMPVTAPSAEHHERSPRRRTTTGAPWSAIGARALMGYLAQTGLTRGADGRRSRRERWPDPDSIRPAAESRRADLGGWSTPRIASLLGGRARSAIVGRLRSLGVVRVVLRRTRRPSAPRRGKATT